MIDKEMKEEVWKVYPKYPWIEASNLGRVRTKDRTVIRSDGRKQFVKGRVLKQWKSNSGYMLVSFCANGKQVKLLVHRIIAITFIPNPNNYPEVNHIDCDRANNRLDNLEWCTHQENITYSNKLGHLVNNNPGKPVIAINPETSEVFFFESQHEAARQLRVSVGNMNSVIKGKHHYKTAGGFWFCYADEKAIEKVRAKFGDKIAKEVEKILNDIT